MKTWLYTVLTCALIASCVKPTPTPPPVVKADRPPVNVSAVTSVDDARVALQNAEAEAEKTRNSLDKARENLAKANSSLKETVAQAAKLATQKTATEGELLDLYNRMVEQEKAYTDLTRDFDATKVSLAAERSARAQIATRLSETERKVVAKDAEAAELRRLLDTSERTAELNAAAVAAERKAAAQAVTTADRLRGEVKVWRNAAIIAGGLLLVIAFLFVLKISGRLALPF